MLGGTLNFPSLPFLKPSFLMCFSSPSTPKPNCTAYEYVNWSSPMGNREWSNQNSVLQPLVLPDSTIQRNPVASIASSVYSKAQQRNAAFIRSPNNAVSLFHTTSTVGSDTKYHSYPDMKHAPSSIPTGKKAFNSTIKERGHFELQPVQIYETEAQSSAGLYAPFLCIREASTIKNDTRIADCFVLANNNSSNTGVSTQENANPTTQFILQKAPPSSSQNVPSLPPPQQQTITHHRRYTKPSISRTEMDSTVIEHFSPMKFLTVSEDVIAEREISLSPSNILGDEQNV